jgi:predicted GNAT superfamily acetyltransferase
MRRLRVHRRWQKTPRLRFGTRAEPVTPRRCGPADARARVHATEAGLAAGRVRYVREARSRVGGTHEGETLGTIVRAIREEDHGTIVPLVNEWWGGRDMSWLLPRLFFQHFGDTSFAVEEGGELVAFLIGFVSQAKEGEAYVHFVGVSPERRGSGVGRRLYRLFFEEVKKRGCRKVSCITSPVNGGSIAFHRAMGFSLKAHDGGAEGGACRCTRATTDRARTGWCSRGRSPELCAPPTFTMRRPRGGYVLFSDLRQLLCLLARW